MAALATSRRLCNGLEVRVITSTKDCSQLAQVKLAAIRTNALNAQMYPLETEPNAMAAYLEEREFQDLHDAELTTVAVVDTQNNSIVARAKCRIPRGLEILLSKQSDEIHRNLDTSTVDDQNSVPESQARGIPQPPKGCNLPLLGAFQSIMRQQRLNNYDAKKDLFLGALYTLPVYQGRGCASALLHWCIAAADACNARIYLESTPSAHNLYHKAGWEDIDSSTIDL